GDGRWAAVLALAPTPILLKWAHDARLHYCLVPILTLLILLLGLRVVDPRATPAGRTRALLVAGLGGGRAPPPAPRPYPDAPRGRPRRGARLVDEPHPHDPDRRDRWRDRASLA